MSGVINSWQQKEKEARTLYRIAREMTSQKQQINRYSDTTTPFIALTPQKIKKERFLQVYTLCDGFGF
jgi:hypothetical protein